MRYVAIFPIFVGLTEQEPKQPTHNLADLESTQNLAKDQPRKKNQYFSHIRDNFC